MNIIGLFTRINCTAKLVDSLHAASITSDDTELQFLHKMASEKIEKARKCLIVAILTYANKYKECPIEGGMTPEQAQSLDLDSFIQLITSNEQPDATQSARDFAAITRKYVAPAIVNTNSTATHHAA